MTPGSSGEAPGLGENPGGAFVHLLPVPTDFLLRLTMNSPRPRCSDPTFTLFIYLFIFFLFPPSPQSFSSLKIHRGLEFAGAALGEPVSFAAAPTWPLCAPCPSVPPHRQPRRSHPSSKKKKPHKRDLVIYFIIFFFKFKSLPSTPPQKQAKAAADLGRVIFSFCYRLVWKLGDLWPWLGGSVCDGRYFLRSL